MTFIAMCGPMAALRGFDRRDTGIDLLAKTKGAEEALRDQRPPVNKIDGVDNL